MKIDRDKFTVTVEIPPPDCHSYYSGIWPNGKWVADGHSCDMDCPFAHFGNMDDMLECGIDLAVPRESWHINDENGFRENPCRPGPDCPRHQG